MEYPIFQVQNDFQYKYQIFYMLKLEHNRSYSIPIFCVYGILPTISWLFNIQQIDKSVLSNLFI